MRTRAFAVARRHSLLVRILRVALPGFAIATLVIYGATTWQLTTLRSAGIKLDDIRISSDHLLMASPSYSGYGKDGSRHTVRARSAETDIVGQKRVKLTTIDGDIVQTSGTTIELKAVRGTFEQDSGVLELFEQIDVRSSDGMTAKLTQATVLTKESKVISNEPITADMPTGNIRAKRMELQTKRRFATFTGDVAVHMKSQQAAKPATPGAGTPAKAPGDTPAKKERAAATGLGPSFSSGEPIDVTSEHLDVDDAKHIAMFRTNVIARQGTSTLAAPELDALYAGRAALPGASKRADAPETPPTPATPADQAAASRLTHLKARGGVVMTRDGDRATATSLNYDAETQRTALAGPVLITSGADRRASGNSAEIDHKTDRMMLDGTVVLHQGRNVLKGEHLTVDRANGRARLDSPADGARNAGRISALLHRADEGRARPKAAETDKGDSGTFGAFRTDPNAPIDIDAAALDFEDAKRSAHFTGSVVAKQGEFIIRTPSLTAFFSGQSSLLAIPTGTGKGSDPATATSLKKIEARQGVVITGKDGQKVTGDSADFDPQSNFATVSGRVVAYQGKNIVEGTKLIMDLTSGRTRMEIDGPQTLSADAVPETSAVPCVPGQNCTSRRRIRAVFYPKDSKQLSKSRPSRKTDGASPPAAGSPAAPAPRASQSSWQSSTTKAPATETPR